MKLFKELHILIFIVTLFGCAQEPTSELDEIALRKLTAEDWDMNAKAGNIDALADSYTDDANRIGNGMVMSGQEEIRSSMKKNWQGDMPDEMENSVEDMRIFGDLAVVRGWFSASTISEEGGNAMKEKGAWIDVCERQIDGNWKMVLTLYTDIGEGNKQIAALYHELNPDDIDAILTDDFIGRNEKSRMTWTKEQHRNYWTSNKDAMKDKIFHQLAEGDWVATWFERTGEWQGEIVSFEMMQFKRFDEGKIAEIWEYGDTQQLDSE